jgi:EAL domain-containing protein (putative c-di-GMP-specific phosphodiesterase class I)
LEITESTLISDPDRTRASLERIAALGVSLSIDDFGTGYSSLSYLKRLPVQAIKIDRSFVKDMLTDQQDMVIVRSTINLASNLGLKVVAEGVEDRTTFNTLRGMGCDLIQGYYSGKPAEHNLITAHLEAGKYGVCRSKRRET